MRRQYLQGLYDYNASSGVNNMLIIWHTHRNYIYYQNISMGLCHMPMFKELIETNELAANFNLVYISTHELAGKRNINHIYKHCVQHANKLYA